MNLISVILYSRFGQRRIVDFKPGQLNIVTGWSGTGKSALLDIVEFCLGRDTVTMPVGVITNTVAWYAVLVQLPSTRAFIARPAPRQGRASTQQAMLELGTDLQPLEFSSLTVNANSDAVREQVGRLIGIGENLGEPELDTLRSPLEAHLGHALLLCLQRQGEIGNRDLLFHRQGEPGIGPAIRDTLPYFLGAVPGDQALKRQELQNLRRQLRREEADLATAEALSGDVEAELMALLVEAHAKGLVPAPDVEGREAIIATLAAAISSPRTQAPADNNGADQRRQLQLRRDQLRRELRDLAEQRALLDQEGAGERNYETAVRRGTARLESIDLIQDTPGNSADICPLCRSDLAEVDPAVDDLRQTLNDLRGHLRSVETARPRRLAVTSQMQTRADALRQELRVNETALAGFRAADGVIGEARQVAEDQAFTKGRIDLYLSKLHTTGDSTALTRLRSRINRTRRAVERLEDDLDPGEMREQVTSRLLIVAEDMTRWADRLQLEHRGRSVRLDLHRLTVVTDTDTGPAPLFRIGSAENWIGYHLVAHLALHRYFVRAGRPVPHLLMLDQPTQAFYPSEVEQRAGVPTDDDDRTAVRRLFELVRDVAAELNPDMQIIVCDHANLPESWFQDAISHNWRGDALIPASWIQGG